MSESRGKDNKKACDCYRRHAGDCEFMLCGLAWGRHFLVCRAGAASDMLPRMDVTGAGLKSCSACSAQMPETAAFCPGCGRSMHSVASARNKVGKLPENIAGA